MGGNLRIKEKDRDRSPALWETGNGELKVLQFGNDLINRAGPEWNLRARELRMSGISSATATSLK